MTAMLERAARAAEKVICDGMMHDGYELDAIKKDIARAVLLAVREPSEDVAMAGAVVGPDTNQGEFSLLDADGVFTAMIDAILNEKDTTND